MDSWQPEDPHGSRWHQDGDLLWRNVSVGGKPHVQEVPHRGTAAHPAVRAAMALGVRHRHLAEVCAAAMDGHDLWLVDGKQEGWQWHCSVSGSSYQASQAPPVLGTFLELRSDRGVWSVRDDIANIRPVLR